MTEAKEAPRTLVLKMLVFGVLIFWMPYVFVWFVLGRNYPLAYRALAIAWTVLWVGFILWFIIYGFFMGGHSPPPPTGLSNT